GTVAQVFTVTLSNPSDRTVTVAYATEADATAAAGVDYQSTSGTLTFAPGQTSRTITVLVNGDLVDELDEAYCVELSNATGGAMIGKGMGQGTIVDDDTASFAISDVTVTEGNSGTVSAVFTISLSTRSDRFTGVSYATANGSAAAGSDYQAASG